MMMVRSRLDAQLDELNNDMIQMGALCEDIITNSTKAFIEKDFDLAREVLKSANDIDKKEDDIERLCLKMLLQQQPVAHDLRVISAALKMITDMERIGDQAEDICEIVLVLEKLNVIEIDNIVKMSNESCIMLSSSIDAYVAKDITLARNVIENDDVVDNLFITVRKDLIKFIRENDEPQVALDLLMIAKYYERIADHATNIAEWVIFSINGDHKNI